MRQLPLAFLAIKTDQKFHPKIYYVTHGGGDPSFHPMLICHQHVVGKSEVPPETNAYMTQWVGLAITHCWVACFFV